MVGILLASCGSKQPRVNDAEVITRNGVITAKEEVSMDEVRSKGQTRGNVYFSVSSGGNVAIGIGVLLGSWVSGQSDTEPVRYEVRLDGGGEMTIYHDSPDFEVTRGRGVWLERLEEES